MTNNVDQIFLWIKDFKNTWLCQHLSHEVYLRNLINTKLKELEDLLHQNHPEETSSSHDEQFHSPDNNLSITIVNQQQTPQRSLPTPPDIHPQSDDDDSMCECRPVIYIKRILSDEAENYLPDYPKLPKKTRKRKVKSRFSNTARIKRRKNKAAKLIVLSDDGTPEIETAKKTKTKKTSLVSTPSTNGHSKEKRRLRPMDDDLSMMTNDPEIDSNLFFDEYGPITRQIGRDGLLSQTRKISDLDHDDVRLVLQSCSAETVIASNVPSGEKSSMPAAIYPDGIEDISNDAVDPPASPSIPFVGHVPSSL